MGSTSSESRTALAGEPCRASYRGILASFACENLLVASACGDAHAGAMVRILHFMAHMVLQWKWSSNGLSALLSFSGCPEAEKEALQQKSGCLKARPGSRTHSTLVFINHAVAVGTQHVRFRVSPIIGCVWTQQSHRTEFVQCFPIVEFAFPYWCTMSAVEFVFRILVSRLVSELALCTKSAPHAPSLCYHRFGQVQAETWQLYV